jgi:hypothetical protein
MPFLTLQARYSVVSSFVDRLVDPDPDMDPGF